MTILQRLAFIVGWIVRRNRAERDLNDELKAFVELAAADRMREGAAPAEARRAAVLHLGGIEQAKERVRSARHGAWLDEVGRDVRYGNRNWFGAAVSRIERIQGGDSRAVLLAGCGRSSGEPARGQRHV